MVAHAFNPITLESGVSKSLLNSSQSTVYTKSYRPVRALSRERKTRGGVSVNMVLSLTEGLKIAESAQSCTVLVVSSCGMAIYLVL